MYKKLADDYKCRILKVLEKCEMIKVEHMIYVINPQNKQWFFNVNLDILYVGYNFWYFRIIERLYGFKPSQGNELLLTIVKTKLKNYTGETGEIIKSLVEWDVQPSFMDYEILDKILKNYSYD
jgi:hypothetical protein